MKIKPLPRPSIWVIVLNYNGKDVLSECLSSIYRSDWPNFEVVVVDNNSTDGSFEQARLNFGRAHFIRNSQNIGFAKGNNVGIRYALEKFADFVFVLNNDTLLEKNTLSLLFQAATNNKTAGIVCPLIYTEGKKALWFGGGKIDWLRMRALHSEKPKTSKPFETEYISGCAMFIKKEVFKQIGIFDERFFLYYEDADFSLRARNAGFKLLVIPACSIIHSEQSSTKNSQKLYWLVLSALLFFHIHTKGAQRMWYQLANLMRVLKNLGDLMLKRTEQAKQIRKAFKDFAKLPLK